MLLLGAVALFEPVNGYQIRRELKSWQVDEWANINPGSIYHALNSLATQGHLVRHDLIDGGRSVTVYEITDQGRAEMAGLVAEALESVDIYSGSAFFAAFAMMTLLERPVAIGHLSFRLEAVEKQIRELDEIVSTNPSAAPPHAVAGMRLLVDKLRAERSWLIETLDDVRSGRFDFVGETTSWTPRDDDPGWQMDADRKRYRSLLGRPDTPPQPMNDDARYLINPADRERYRALIRRRRH
ncbi:MAG: helix-turn-helix transcriptional regulator [Nocardioides sp.]|nr:helix-turn-helix transcriptional regulator [Nocardioides sp.]